MKPVIFIIFVLFSLVSVSQEIVSCVICLDTVEGNIVQKTCGHSFHEHCIEKWLEKRPICPICKQALKEPAAKQNPEEEAQPYIAQVQQDIQRMQQIEPEMQLRMQQIEQIHQQIQRRTQRCTIQ